MGLLDIEQTKVVHGASFSDKLDYSGFNPATWLPRTEEKHRAKGFDWKQTKTLSI